MAAQIPARMEDLVRLPGVGRKTANVVSRACVRRAWITRWIAMYCECQTGSEWRDGDDPVSGRRSTVVSTCLPSEPLDGELRHVDSAWPNGFVSPDRGVMNAAVAGRRLSVRAAGDMTTSGDGAALGQHFLGGGLGLSAWFRLVAPQVSATPFSKSDQVRGVR